MMFINRNQTRTIITFSLLVGVDRIKDQSKEIGDKCFIFILEALTWVDEWISERIWKTVNWLKNSTLVEKQYNDWKTVHWLNKINHKGRMLIIWIDTNNVFPDAASRSQRAALLLFHEYRSKQGCNGSNKPNKHLCIPHIKLSWFPEHNAAAFLLPSNTVLFFDILLGPMKQNCYKDIVSYLANSHSRTHQNNPSD